MKKLKYGIIYAVIRSEISEQISLGLILIDQDKVKIRYSAKKLQALKSLYSPKEYEMIAKIIRSMPGNDQLKTIGAIHYLSRYSHNLITVSNIQTVDVEPTLKNEDWLFRNYVYSRNN